MKDFKQKMVDFDIVGKHKIWYLIPVIVLLTAAIVFSVFAYRGGSAASGSEHVVAVIFHAEPAQSTA